MKHYWEAEELIETFILLPDEQQLLSGDEPQNQLGCAVLLKFFQAEARFPDSAAEIPEAVVEYLAAQVGVNPALFSQYRWQGRTINRHRALIRDRLGFRPATRVDQAELHTWLLETALPNEHRVPYLEAMAYRRLRQLHLEPPTPDRMERLVNSAFDTFEERFFRQTFERLPQEVRARLDQLVTPSLALEDDEDPDESSRLPLHHLKLGPGKPNVPNLRRVADRLQLLQEIDLPEDLFAGLPRRFLRVYRQRAGVEAISHVNRHKPYIHYSLLAAFCWIRQREITDQLVELFIEIIHDISFRAERKVERVMIDSVKHVSGKDRLLANLAEAMLAFPDGVIRQVLYPLTNEEELQSVVTEYRSGSAYQRHVQQTMHRSYNYHYRQMLPVLLRVLEFRSNNAVYRPVLDGLEVVAAHLEDEDRLYPLDEDIPLDGVVPPGLRRWLVERDKYGNEHVIRANYELCVLQALRDRVRRKEIWVVGADHYRNPDEDLPSDFEENRELNYEALALPLDVETFITELQRLMHQALTMFNENLPGNPQVVLQRRGGKPWIKVTPPDVQLEPTNLRALKKVIDSRWPVNLIDILKEVDLRVGFTQHFTSLRDHERMSRSKLQKRLLLCLFGLGTNMGIKRVSRGPHGEKYDDLRYVRKHFIHKDALRQAIAAVVNATLEARQPHIWGEATTACASDSKKFAAWDQNLLTKWHLRYRGPGVMVYWHVEKNSLCIYSQLKTPSSSEVASMIEGVLRHCTQMQVEKNYVDTHGQSEIAFAFCHLLGFQLLPRIKDIGTEKLHRPFAGEGYEYPNLDPILILQPIDWELIRQQYDQMVKYATALRLGTADAEAILKRFTRHNPQHPTYQALVELGRVMKTIFLCEYLSSVELRQEIHEGLNVLENWNSANSFIFYGKSSEISSNDLDAQEVAILSLHLLQTSLVYLNTLLLQEVLARPEWFDRMTEADWRGLNPLFYAHINPYGLIDLNMDERIAIEYQVAA